MVFTLLVDFLVGLLIGRWLIGRSDWLIGWSFDLFVGRVIGWPVDC